MKTFILLTALVGSIASASAPVFAMDAMHGSMMHGSMMTPSCAAGDPVVGVNTKTKMYMSHDQMKMKMAGMSSAKKHEMMMQSNMKMMCKSKADAMGGKMMSSKM